MPRTEATVTMWPPVGRWSMDGRKAWRVWKWERRFMVKLRESWEGVRERREELVTMPALFIRIVGVPSYWGCL